MVIVSCDKNESHHLSSSSLASGHHSHSHCHHHHCHHFHHRGDARLPLSRTPITSFPHLNELFLFVETQTQLYLDKRTKGVNNCRYTYIYSQLFIPSCGPQSQPSPSTPQVPFKRPHIPTNRDHKAVPKCTTLGRQALKGSSILNSWSLGALWCTYAWIDIHIYIYT